MVLPALVGIGATLSGIYSVGKAVDNYRYWDDYYKKTGFRPKYMWRTYGNSMSGFGSGFSSFGKLKRL